MQSSGAKSPFAGPSAVRRLDPDTLASSKDRLTRCARALCHSADEAEDLVQETFVRVLARPRLVHSDEEAYLLRALRNVYLTRRQTRSRLPIVAPLPRDDVGLPSALGAAAPEAEAEAHELIAAISALPPALRGALVAVDLLGLSYGEAAAHLRIPPGTVMSRLHRARSRVMRSVTASE